MKCRMRSQDNTLVLSTCFETCYCGELKQTTAETATRTAKKRQIQIGKTTTLGVACVASASARVRRERWDKSGKKRNDGGGVGERRFPLLPSPFHFFCSRSNSHAITRMETLATQATLGVHHAFFVHFFAIVARLRRETV